MIRNISVTLLALFLLLISTLIFTVSTETGLSLLWTQVNKLLPEEISVDSVDGKLIGPMSITGLSYQTETIQVKIDQIEITWSPSNILSKTFDLSLVELNNLQVTQISKNSEDPEPFSLPEKIQLPLKIIIERLYINRFLYQPLAESDPFYLDYAELASVFDNDKFVIDKLDVSGPTIRLAGYLQTVPHSGYSSQGELDWKFIVDGFYPVDGLTTYTGNLQKLDIKKILQSPYDLDASITLNNIVDSLGYSVNLNVSQLNLREINSSYPEALVKGTVDLDGNLHRTNITASINSDETKYGKLNANLNGEISKQFANIRQLIISANDDRTQLLAQGKINLSDEDSLVDISATWEDLSWPLLAEPQVISKQGKVKIVGDLNQYQIQSNADIDVPDRLNATISIEGRGDKHSLAISKLDANLLQGDVQGTSTVKWHPAFEVEADLAGNNINPKQLIEDWSGKLNFQLKTVAKNNQGKLSAEFDQLDVQGTLRDHRLNLTSKGYYRNNEVNLDQFTLISGTSKLTANGSIGERLDIRWKFDSENINTLLPKSSGSIHSTGIAQGALNDLLLKSNIKGTSLAFKEYKLEAIDMYMDVDLGDSKQSKLDFKIENLEINDTLIHSSEIQIAGTTDQHTLDFSLKSNQGDTTLLFTGTLTEFPSKNTKWNFKVEEGMVAHPKLTKWNLISSANGTISKSLSSISPTCLSSQRTKFCIDGSYQGEKSEANFKLTKLPFTYFSEYFPEDLDIAGEMSGKGTYHALHGKGAFLDIEFDTSATEIYLPDDKGEPVSILAFKAGKAKLSQNELGLHTSVDLPLADSGGLMLDAKVNSAAAPLLQRPLDGSIDIHLNDLSTYEKFIPQVETLMGKVNGTITLGGNLQSPVFNGQLSLSDAGVNIPGLGLALSNIEIDLTGTNTENVTIKGGVRSGGGELIVDGTLALADKTGKTELNVLGENFEVINTQDAHIYASPSLQIGMQGKTVMVNGDISIPQATITPGKQTSSGSITVSEDQIIVAPEGEEQKVPYLVTTNVKLSLGPDVSFNAYGLNSNIEGELDINDEPKRRTTAKGTLILVDGGFSAYGQELKIETGEIIFSGGPIDQPGIDLRASRKARNDILVGVDVRGNLNNPNIELFSEPTMSRSEQLSYLTLGKPLQDTTAGESSAINQAALSIGFSKGNKITDQIGEQFGFDSAGFETTNGEEGEQNAFVLGKYLSPKLYISYGIGVFEAVNVFRLQYFLSKNWKVVTESSGGNSGGDIYYEIERGQ